MTGILGGGRERPRNRELAVRQAGSPSRVGTEISPRRSHDRGRDEDQRTDAVWMLQCYVNRDPPARRATASAVEENASGS